MSYQLPDLLGLLNSLAGTDDDGDLHINPLYQTIESDSAARSITSALDSLVLPASQSARNLTSPRLHKRADGLLQEYNPGLLASTLFPFPSFPESDQLAKSVLQFATEWVAMCALVVEEMLRPGRVGGLIEVGAVPKEMGGNGKLWEQCEAQLYKQCSLSHEGKAIYQSMKRDLLDALIDAPPRPGATISGRESPLDSTSIQEYIRWRTAISGHKILLNQYFSSSSAKERARFNRVAGLVLEINACVTDLFAYNVHQAWYSSQHKQNRNCEHLNLVSYLMAADPEMTIQGAISCAGDIIRQRVVEFNGEIEALDTTSEPAAPVLLSSSGTKTAIAIGGLRSSLSSLVSLLPLFSSNGSSSGVVQQVSALSSSSDDSPGQGSDNRGRDNEIKKVLVNWVRGTVHWAYEVEYFYPNGAGGDATNGKKRGSEVRDYGWVFLIKEP